MKGSLKGRIINIDRSAAWLLALTSVLTIATGYASTRGTYDRHLLNNVHTTIEWVFIGLFVFHSVVVLFYTRYNWKFSLRRLWHRQANNIQYLRFLQRLTGWLVFISTFVVILSGWTRSLIIQLNLLPFNLHLNYDLYLVLFLSIHISLGALLGLKRKGYQGPRINALVFILASFIVLNVITLDLAPLYTPTPPSGNQPPSNGNQLPSNQTPLMAYVTIGDTNYEFNARAINTIRPDLFKPGHFSMFDILVHLDNNESIDLEYHFNSSMNTYVIDSINNETNWWYYAYYDGGWVEKNVFRMDHYPWKEGTTVRFFHHPAADIQNIYNVWAEEINRLENNNGTLIIPRVVISGFSFREFFYNVTVTPHNLRNDVFQDNVTTAIDLVMSLGDQGQLSYELKWYESISDADPVKSYWVDAINGDKAHDSCGFVYEAGDEDYKRFTGNHIHIPSDVRIINSPEYLEYFWICLT